MKSTRYVVTALMGLLLTVMGSGRAWADAVPTNDAYSMTILITPNIDRGVSIDTSNVTLDLGTQNLYASVGTVQPATVTILGNLSSSGSETTGQELDLSLTFSGGWTLDATPSTGPNLGAVDELAVYALFSNTTLSGAPLGHEFAVYNGDFTISSGRAGGAGGGVDGTKFEYIGGAPAQMDHMSVDDQRHLWMFFRLPNTTTVGAQQSITLTATAANAD